MTLTKVTENGSKMHIIAISSSYGIFYEIKKGYFIFLQLNKQIYLSLLFFINNLFLFPSFASFLAFIYTTTFFSFSLCFFSIVLSPFLPLLFISFPLHSVPLSLSFFSLHPPKTLCYPLTLHPLYPSIPILYFFHLPSPPSLTFTLLKHFTPILPFNHYTPPWQDLFELCQSTSVQLIDTWVTPESATVMW